MRHGILVFVENPQASLLAGIIPKLPRLDRLRRLPDARTNRTNGIFNDLQSDRETHDLADDVQGGFSGLTPRGTNKRFRPDPLMIGAIPKGLCRRSGKVGAIGMEHRSCRPQVIGPKIVQRLEHVSDKVPTKG